MTNYFSYSGPSWSFLSLTSEQLYDMMHQFFAAPAQCEPDKVLKFCRNYISIGMGHYQALSSGGRLAGVGQASRRSATDETRGSLSLPTDAVIPIAGSAALRRSDAGEAGCWRGSGGGQRLTAAPAAAARSRDFGRRRRLHSLLKTTTMLSRWHFFLARCFYTGPGQVSPLSLP